MAFTVKGKKDAGATTLLQDLASLAASNGTVTNFVDNADGNNLGSRSVRVMYKFTIGASVVSNAPMMFFLVTADDETTQHNDGDPNLTVSTSASTLLLSGSGSPEADEMFFKLGPAVHSRPVSISQGTDYSGSFVVDVTGARYWAIYAYNVTGDSLTAPTTDHYIRFIADVPDIR